MTDDSRDRRSGSLLSRFGVQLLGFGVFVGFPALFTAIAPVSWVKFERHGERVSATTRTCLLFVVPYRRARIEPVEGIGDRFIAGAYARRPTSRRERETRSEDEGFLVIRGGDQAAEISVSPVNLDSVVKQSEAFLEDANSTELKLFVVANWKFSVIGGGLVSLLTVLYVGGIAFELLRKTLGLFRR